MSTTYAPLTPRGKDGNQKVGYSPAKVALVTTNKENAAASSILLLSHDTTELHIAAVGQHIMGKWLTQSIIDSSVAGTSVLTGKVAGPNFDFVVQTDTTKNFVVPIATSGGSYGSIQGVNRREGLFPAIAYKTSAGNGSVLTVEL